MAAVEHSWFQRQLQGKDEPRMFGKDEDRDADFDEVAADPAVVEEAFALWREQVRAAEDYSRAIDDLGPPSTSTVTRSRSATSWCT